MLKKSISVKETATDYLQQGWTVMRLPPRSKEPYKGKSFAACTVTRDNIDKLKDDENLAVIFSTAGALKDLDCDYQESADLARAIGLEGAAFGRASVGIGHYLFNAPGCEAKKFLLPEGDYPRDLPVHDGKRSLLVLEIRGNDSTYTMFPPSVHPCGERLDWIDARREPAKTTAVELRTLAGRHALASAALYFYPKDATARYDTRMALTGALSRAGMPADLVTRYVQAVARLAGDPKWEEDFAARTEKRLKDDKKVTGVTKLIEVLQLPPACLGVFYEWLNDSGEDAADVDEQDENPRPVIQIRPGKLPKIATRGEEVLLASGLPTYQRGDDLVRPVIEDVAAAYGRTTKAARFICIDTVYLSDLLGRVARWQRYIRGRWSPIDVPEKVAARILGRKGEWKFPKVTGIISTPTLREDGTILDQEGYDPATKLLLLAPPSMPAIAENPTREDALAALALLEDLLVEFPLVGKVDKSVALSGLITPVVRGAFMVAPMHAARAPVAGSGKSYLWDCASAIAAGQRMPVISKGPSEEELEKRLGTEMMTGQPLISIDNVNGELKSDALCQITERPVVHIRILGKSERVRIEARGTTVFCTGNNIIIVGDLCRRIIMAMLDPQLERPELREFKNDPVAKILSNRGAYIAACLTICRAYIVAGRPNKVKRLASYEGWSDSVRSALIWLGNEDPVASMDLMQKDDPEISELRELLEAWTEVFGLGKTYGFTLQEIVDEANKEKDSGARLNAIVRAVAGARGKEPANTNGLSYYLRSKKGRIVDGMRLTNDAGSRRAKWWIEAQDKIGGWSKEQPGVFGPGGGQFMHTAGIDQVDQGEREASRKRAAEGLLAYAKKTKKLVRGMRH